MGKGSLILTEETLWYYKMSEKYLESLEEDIANYRKTSDDQYINKGCTDLQECLELLFKGILDCYEREYSKKGTAGHEIMDLLDRVLSETDVNFSEKSKNNLLRIGDTITSWEADGKYVKSVLTALQTIEMGKNIYKEIHESFETIIKSNS